MEILNQAKGNSCNAIDAVYQSMGCGEPIIMEDGYVSLVRADPEPNIGSAVCPALDSVKDILGCDDITPR